MKELASSLGDSYVGVLVTLAGEAEIRIITTVHLLVK